MTDDNIRSIKKRNDILEGMLNEVYPEVSDITDELFSMGFVEDDSVGQRVNTLRHNLIRMKSDLERLDGNV